MSHPTPHTLQSALFSHKTIIPTITLDNPKYAAPLAHAIHDAGGQILKITLRSPQALEAISLAKAEQEIHQVTIAAGTILSRQDAENAHAAGADLLISPIYNDEIAQFVREKALFWIPGVMTPNEALYAYRQGFSLLKLFPTALIGGIKMLEALYSIAPQLQWVAHGGINITNLRDYANQPNIAALECPWLCEMSSLQCGDLSSITHALRDALETLSPL
ncbi:MAG: bifunctional 4-hydroxy-2-oxoglutarate aldolase/2-dehydro-3-deoxy-phosphogluconate aldolase [Cardiobacteriaceae bacterium]|nr:bifunctional 4-hydroxy-2-oxoglutarate aldolase/2-dehydro-3-deoxy-phosphogluconate aldolase [Cardiobacteriaceae bacterium]